MAAAVEHNDAAKARQLAQASSKPIRPRPTPIRRNWRWPIEHRCGKPADAVAPLSQVMNNSKDDELRRIARLRLARVLIDQGKPDDAIKTLAEDKPAPLPRSFTTSAGRLLRQEGHEGRAAEYTAALAGAEMGGVIPADPVENRRPQAAAAAPAAASTAPPPRRPRRRAVPHEQGQT